MRVYGGEEERVWVCRSGVGGSMGQCECMYSFFAHWCTASYPLAVGSWKVNLL